jgi:hypothetical protein
MEHAPQRSRWDVAFMLLLLTTLTTYFAEMPHRDDAKELVTYDVVPYVGLRKNQLGGGR